jgi:hypothetical protein
MVIITIHNLIGLYDGKLDTRVTNAWGAFLIFLTFGLLALSPPPLAYLRAPFRWLISMGAVSYSAIIFLVYFGVLRGNTGKLVTGQGGVGASGHSTNDTALLGCALLIWSTYFFLLKRRDGGRRAFGIAACAILAGIGMTQSRIGLLACGVAVILLVLSRSSQILKSRRIIVFGCIAVLGILGLQIAYQRTLVEINSQATFGYLAGGDFSASGRTIIWAEYLSAFLSRSGHEWWAWIVGFGPNGIPELYESTILSQVGLVTEGGAFLPTHSDLVWVLLATGSIGVLFIIAAVLWWQRAIPSRSALAWPALSVFLAFSAFDMVQYSYPASLLLLLAFQARSEVTRLSQSEPLPAGGAAVGVAQVPAKRQLT